MGYQDYAQSIKWWAEERRRALAFGESVFSQPWSGRHDRLLASLLRDVIQKRRLWRRFLWRRFSYNVRRREQVPANLRGTDAGTWQLFQATFSTYLRLDALFGVCSRLAPQQALEVLLNPLTGELWSAMHAKTAPPELREEAILQLSGRAYSLTSLSTARRLADRLAREHGSARQGLMAELPGTVAALLADGRVDDALWNVPSEIERSLKRDGDSSRYVDTPVYDLRLISVPPDVEIEARDHGERMLTEADGALAPREREVFRLTLDGLSGPEIAELLNIKPSTVNVLQWRVREKLRRIWGYPTTVQ